jgi:hypothetical protein
VLPSAADTHVMTTMLNTRSLALNPRRSPALTPCSLLVRFRYCWLVTGRPRAQS